MKLSPSLNISLVLILFIFQAQGSIDSDYSRRGLIFTNQAKNQLIVGTFIHPKYQSSGTLPESIIECTIAGDSDRIGEILATHHDYPVLIVSEAKLDHLIHRCARKMRESLLGLALGHPDPVISLSDMLIVPGTKWCGPGNRSASYDDLGSSVEIDKCCREHDYCPESIEPHGTKYNLTNKSFITSSSCECDAKLKSCLREASETNFDAAIVGNIYFNMLKVKCFKKVKAKGPCIKYRGLPFLRRCVRYAKSESDAEVYQFFTPESF